MTGAPAGPARNGKRRAILDLAPLESDCLNVLWPLGQGTVREIRDALAATRPRAYTTIMTIMDRLARKGLVSRQKVGRAYLYRPNVTAEETREQAVSRLVEHFFGGSRDALVLHLSGGTGAGGVAALAPETSPGPAQAERIDDSLL